MKILDAENELLSIHEEKYVILEILEKYKLWQLIFDCTGKFAPTVYKHCCISRIREFVQQFNNGVKSGSCSTFVINRIANSHYFDKKNEAVLHKLLKKCLNELDVSSLRPKLIQHVESIESNRTRLKDAILLTEFIDEILKMCEKEDIPIPNALNTKELLQRLRTLFSVPIERNETETETEDSLHEWCKQCSDRTISNLTDYENSLNLALSLDTFRSFLVYHIRNQSQEDMSLFYFAHCIRHTSFHCYRRNIIATFFENQSSIHALDQFSILKVSDAEFKTLEKWLDKVCNKDIVTVFQFVQSLEMYNERGAIINAFCKAYKIPIGRELKQGLDLLAKLRKDKYDGIDKTLIEISEVLKPFKTIVDKTSDNDWTVFELLGNSPQMIEFMRKINKEQITRLLQTFKEGAQSHLPISVLEGFVRIYREISPIMHKTETSDFTTVRVAYTKIAEDTRNKFKDDVKNSIAFLGRIKNLCARSLCSTKLNHEIIDQVCENCIVTFTNENYKCCVSIKCVSKTQTIVDTSETYSETMLRSLANWARLSLTRNKKEFNAQLQAFIDLCDSAFQINELLQTLQDSGIHYSEVIAIPKEEICLVPIESLQELKQKEREISKLYKNCKTTLIEERTRNNILNYFCFKQFIVLKNIFKDKLSKTSEEFQQSLGMVLYVNRGADITKQDQSHKYKMSTNLFDQLPELSNCVIQMCETCDPGYRYIEPENCEAQDKVEQGIPYIVVVDDVAKMIPTILAIYANNCGKLPLPHEIIFCREGTSFEQVEILIARASKTQLERHGADTMYCIVSPENLSFEDQEQFVQCLNATKLDQTRFVIILGDGCFESSPLQCLAIKGRTHYQMSKSQIEHNFKTLAKNVQVITSDLPGQGKTEQIYQDAMEAGFNVQSILISGKIVHDQLVKEIFDLQPGTALHLDVSHVDNPRILDMFLFEYLIIGCAASMTHYIHYDQLMKVYIEIANSDKDNLCESIFLAKQFQNKRESKTSPSICNFQYSKELFSPIQIVMQHLIALDENKIDREVEFDKSKFAILKGDAEEWKRHERYCNELLEKHLRPLGDISFNTINIFVKVLAVQLRKFTISPVFHPTTILALRIDEHENVRRHILEGLIEIAKDFARRFTSLSNERLESHDILSWHDTNHNFLLFNGNCGSTVTPVYKHKRSFPSETLYFIEKQGQTELKDMATYNQDEFRSMIRNFIGTDGHLSSEMDQRYVLTPDNVLKMIVISMRIQARIPIIIMGETGCGKTALVQYLAAHFGEELDIMSLHIGVTESEIIAMVKHLEYRAKCNGKAWLFLDEINTCPHLGLISDIVCHRRIQGRHLSDNLVIVATCNPYRKRTDLELHSDGLEIKHDSNDSVRSLVYQVQKLPQTMLEYVWDFGYLSKQDEECYIRNMVNGLYQSSNQDLECIIPEEDVAKAICESQTFFQEREDLNRYVSLRDVSRCCNLFEWFYKELERRDEIDRTKLISNVPVKKWTHRERSEKALILALYHCYGLRLNSSEDRNNYLAVIARCVYSGERAAPNVSQYIAKEQVDFLERFDTSNLAKNIALRENTYALFVSIMNRIPIFLVGKPGSSKSLSVQLLRNELKGEDSDDEYIKTLPMIQLIAFQGSEAATACGIKQVFDDARQCQAFIDSHNENTIAVVLLDEMSLIEKSTENAIRALHTELEPVLKESKKITLIGISNYKLDSAKMNRAIYVSRPDMDTAQLQDTAKSLCKAQANLVRSIADKYQCIVKPNLDRNISELYGLRDFYELIKYISKYDNDITDVLLKGLQRNFGGSQHLVTGGREFSKIQLIHQNLIDYDARYLMLITDNDLLCTLIQDKVISLSHNEQIEKTTLIIGSECSSDDSEGYHFECLRSIIYSIQFEDVIIMRRLGRIYQSLYDFFNRNYSREKTRQWCRIALGNINNDFCDVHTKLRCVVIVSESEAKGFDLPLLSRFEKQYLSLKDLQNPLHQNCMQKVKQWITQFTTDDNTGHKLNAFVGLQCDEIIHSIINRYIECTNNENSVVDSCIIEIIKLARPESVVRLKDGKTIRENYFSLSDNQGLIHYIEAFMRNRSNGKCVIFTHTAFTTELRVLTLRIAQSVSEKKLIGMIKSYDETTNAPYLVLQCTSNLERYFPILLKCIDDVLPRSKFIFVIIHSERYDTAPSVIRQNTWEFTFLDDLEDDAFPLQKLMNKTKRQLIDMKYVPLSDVIRKHLPDALRGLNYSSLVDKVKLNSHIVNIIQQEEVVNAIENVILSTDLGEDLSQSDMNIEWQLETASCVDLLYNMSLKKSWQNQVEAVLKKRLSHIVYTIEKYSAWSSSDTSHKSNWLAQLLHHCFENKESAIANDEIAWIGHLRYKLPFIEGLFVAMMNVVSDAKLQNLVHNRSPDESLLREGAAHFSFAARKAFNKYKSNIEWHDLFCDFLAFVAKKYQHDEALQVIEQILNFKHNDYADIDYEMCRLIVCFKLNRTTIVAVLNLMTLAQNLSNEPPLVADLKTRQDLFTAIKAKVFCVLFENVLSSNINDFINSTEKHLELAVGYMSIVFPETKELQFLKLCLDVKNSCHSEETKIAILSFLTENNKDMCLQYIILKCKTLHQILPLNDANDIWSMLYLRSLKCFPTPEVMECVLSDLMQQNTMKFFGIVIDWFINELENKVNLQQAVIEYDIGRDMFEQRTDLPHAWDIIDKSLSKYSISHFQKLVLVKLETRMRNQSINFIVSDCERLLIQVKKFETCSLIYLLHIAYLKAMYSSLPYWKPSRETKAQLISKCQNLMPRDDPVFGAHLMLLYAKVLHTGTIKELRDKFNIESRFHSELVSIRDSLDTHKDEFLVTYIPQPGNQFFDLKNAFKDVKNLDSSAFNYLKDPQLNLFAALLAVAHVHYWMQYLEESPERKRFGIWFEEKLPELPKRFGKNYMRVISGLCGIADFNLPLLTKSEGTTNMQFPQASVILHVLFISTAFFPDDSSITENLSQNILINSVVCPITLETLQVGSNKTVKELFDNETKECNVLLRLCRLLLQSGILGSMAIDIPSNYVVNEQLYANEWKSVQDLLHLSSKDLMALLNILINEISCKESCSFDKMKRIVRENLSKFHMKLRSFKEQVLKQYKLTNSIEGRLQDFHQPDHDRGFDIMSSSICSQQLVIPDISLLKSQVTVLACTQPDKYPFLTLCVDNEYNVLRLKHCVSLLMFICRLKEKTHLKLSNEEVTESIEEYFKSTENGDKAVLHSFIETWTTLRQSLFAGRGDLANFQRNTVLKEFLQEMSQIQLFEVLWSLAEIQNTFIKSASRIPQVQVYVQEPGIDMFSVSAETLILFEWSVSLLLFSQNKLDKGCWGIVDFDYAFIERELARNLLQRKRRIIKSPFTPIVLKDELFYHNSHILRNIETYVLQTPLRHEELHELIHQCEKCNIQIKEVYAFLQAILPVVRYSSPTDSLIELAERWFVGTKIWEESIKSYLKTHIHMQNFKCLYEHIECEVASRYLDRKGGGAIISQKQKETLIHLHQNHPEFIRSLQTSLLRLTIRFPLHTTHTGRITEDTALKDALFKSYTFVWAESDTRDEAVIESFPTSLKVKHLKSLHHFLIELFEPQECIRPDSTSMGPVLDRSSRSAALMNI